MKIVSLLPSTTEIAYLLGLGEQLVAVTHECDYPPEAATKPVITRSALDHAGNASHTIDAAVSGELHAGRSIYHIDQALLERLDPDLILTQELCEVCAVSYAEVQEACQLLGGTRRILSLEPSGLEGILETICEVGRATGQERAAEAAVAELRERIDRVRARGTAAPVRPRVYCMEWLDPPFAAGHWVPEMTAIAGGVEGLGQLHRDSRRLSWDEVRAYDPEVLVLMPCGFGVARVLEELPLLRGQPGWKDLAAVRSSRVWAVDGSSYFNRPGPRIVDGLEILAHLIQPELFPEAPPENAAVRVG